MPLPDFEKLGLFYLGHRVGLDNDMRPTLDKPEELVLYDSQDLTTHAVCIGMTGSGKTGLCLGLLEEALIDGYPVIAIDPKGDLSNLALTFKDLDPNEFKSWIDFERPDLKRMGDSLDKDQVAEQEAKKWSAGLAAFGQSKERIAMLKNAGKIRIFTPGANFGTPVSILNALQRPSREVLDDADLLKERVSGAATCLLSLIGMAFDPLKSREHIYLSNIFTRLWQSTNDGGANSDMPDLLDLADLVRHVQSPPFAYVGALDLESFYPQKDRQELAMAINNLIAAPGFETWLRGEPLIIDDMMHSADGKPCISIFSISHLNDNERMFFVTLLLNEMVAWMRSKSGTSSLRAILYMDEIFGYFPPVANPPSKQPLLTLMKQARAFGLGVVLASQNPVDLDYKGLANAGTWFVGRLQTERDKARLLDGLESSAGENGQNFDRAMVDKALSNLQPRVFLMNNVHDSKPEIFKTRWTLSYLRGPLTRREIKSLCSFDNKSEAPASDLVQTPRVIAGPQADRRPIISQDIPVAYIPPEVARFSDQLKRIYVPCLLASAKVRFVDAKLGLDVFQDRCLIVPVDQNAERSAVIDFGKGKSIRPKAVVEDGLAGMVDPLAGFTFQEPRAMLLQADNFKGYKSAFIDYLVEHFTYPLMQCKLLKEKSKANESEKDFRIRLTRLSQELKAEAMARLKDKYEPRLRSLQEKLEAAHYKADEHAREAERQKINSAVNVGATVLGAVFGRKVLSTRNMDRAARAYNDMARIERKEAQAQASRDSVEALEERLMAMSAQFDQEAAAVIKDYDITEESLDVVRVRAKKANIKVDFIGIGWVPA